MSDVRYAQRAICFSRNFLQFLKNQNVLNFQDNFRANKKFNSIIWLNINEVSMQTLLWSGVASALN